MEYKNIRRLLSFARRAVQDYDMIEDGDVIAVCVSGGKDSLALLLTMQNLALFYPKKYKVMALTLDMGFEGCDLTPLEEFYKEIGVEYRIVKTSIAQIIFEERRESNPCALCAKMRRGLLHDNAKEMGANKIALGHNYDDMLETFMMNLFNEGRISTFSPVTYLDRKDITVIRPLSLAPEKDIKYFIGQNDFPIIESHCPEDKHTDRERYKEMLYSLDRERCGTMHRLFEAIKKADVDGWGVDNREVLGTAFEISSTDIEATREYYEKTLGFTSESYNMYGKACYMMKRAGASIILSSDGIDTRHLYIVTARLDSLYSSLSAMGAEPDEPFFNGEIREFSLTDIDGRRITFVVKKSGKISDKDKEKGEK